MRWLIVIALVVGCGDPLEGLTVVGDDPSDDPVPALDDDQLARFHRGDAIFEAPFRDTQGLGPLWVRSACASCHAEDARGPGLVRKMVLLDARGEVAVDQSALAYGHTVRPQYGAGATMGITPPEALDVWVTRRFPPAVFGRGYLEAIEDAEIERAEAEQAADGLVSGRVHRVAWQSEANPGASAFHAYGPGSSGLIGRFGLKARIATLDEFAADALQGDMGLTSPLRPAELPNPDALEDDALEGVDVDEDTVNAAADYVRLLAIPSRPPAPEGGAALFDALGCASCHRPMMRTRADYPIAQLAGVDAPIYSDLLLHDMGAALADGLTEGDASPREWRTAPLIGLRHLRAYLHDGRALDLDEAVRLHGEEGSEARFAADRYLARSSDERALVLAFLETL